MKIISILRSFACGGVFAGALLLPGGHSDAGAPPRKVTICHKGSTLEISEAALQAHLNHGDTMGPCQISPDQNR